MYTRIWFSYFILFMYMPSESAYQCYMTFFNVSIDHVMSCGITVALHCFIVYAGRVTINKPIFCCVVWLPPTSSSDDIVTIIPTVSTGTVTGSSSDDNG